jgi:hypothetical protein
MSVVHSEFKPTFGGEILANWVIDRKLVIWFSSKEPEYLHASWRVVEAVLKKGRERRGEEKFYPTTDIHPIIILIFKAKGIEIRQ